MKLPTRRERYVLESGLFSPVTRDDTYLVSFPRSGNTWLRCMITSLVHGTGVTPELVAATVPDMRRSDRVRPAHLDPLIAKSHTLYLDLPAKVVYLVRDGRDATLSFHHYLVERGRIPTDTAPGDLLFNDTAWLPPWHEHVTGWLDGLERRRRRSAGRHLVLRYEDLAADPGVHLEAVARLAGLSGVSDARLEQAVRLNRRDRLRRIERQAGPGSLNHLDLQRPHWREVLSRREVAHYQEVAGAVLARLGYAPGIEP